MYIDCLTLRSQPVKSILRYHTLSFTTRVKTQSSGGSMPRNLVPPLPWPPCAGRPMPLLSVAGRSKTLYVASVSVIQWEVAEITRSACSFHR